MRNIVRGALAFSESPNRKSRKIWFAILSSLVGIGIGLRLLEASNPGTIVDLLSILKAIGMAIWKMVCDVAHACAGFIRYVEGARSR